MKLKKVCSDLASQDAPPKRLEFMACRDADKCMDAFLPLLIASDVQDVLLRTDFLTSMSEDNVLKFFRALGELSNLQVLIIQSSSRFHIESIPPSGLLSLRNAKRLKRLGLEDMQVTAMHKGFISGLGIALRSHATLQELIMTNFFANDWANTDPDVLDALVLDLTTVPNLHRLELSGCGSHALCGQDVRLLSPSALIQVVSIPTLEHLQLSFLELDDEHFEAMASVLKNNKSIRTIALDYHKLESIGFCHMMQAMQTNVTVKTLSLRSLQDIGHEGFQQAMKMLQLNYVIENLSVTATPYEQAQIDLYLRMNGAGRGLLRDPTTSMSQWVDVLAKSSDDLDVVRHLLQEIPGLCNAAALAAGKADNATTTDGTS